MNWLNINPMILGILSWGFGIIVSSLAHYILLVKDISFIKGQLILLIDEMKAVLDNPKKIAVLEVSVERNRSYLDFLHEKVKQLEIVINHK